MSTELSAAVSYGMMEHYMQYGLQQVLKYWGICGAYSIKCGVKGFLAV
jgi:hypothetical protein